MAHRKSGAIRIDEKCIMAGDNHAPSVINLRRECMEQYLPSKKFIHLRKKKKKEKNGGHSFACVRISSSSTKFLFYMSYRSTE